MSKSLCALLHKALLKEVPLTRHMNLQVREYDGQSLHLYYPIEQNVHHAFAGSIYSLATLAGWGLIYLKLHALKLPAHTMIQKGTIHYRRPITKDFENICKIEDSEKFDKFIYTLQRKCLARIQLHSIITSEHVVNAQFEGSFVSKKPRDIHDF